MAARYSSPCFFHHATVTAVIAVHFQHRGVDDEAGEVVAPLIGAGWHTQEVPEAIDRERLTASVHIGPQLHYLVERDRILGGHGADDLGLDSSPTVRSRED